MSAIYQSPCCYRGEIILVGGDAEAEARIGVVALFSLALKSEQLRNFIFTNSPCSQNRLWIIVSSGTWGWNHALMLRHQDHGRDGRATPLLVQAVDGGDGGNNDSIHTRVRYSKPNEGK